MCRSDPGGTDMGILPPRHEDTKVHEGVGAGSGVRVQARPGPGFPASGGSYLPWRVFGSHAAGLRLGGPAAKAGGRGCCGQGGERYRGGCVRVARGDREEIVGLPVKGHRVGRRFGRARLGSPFRVPLTRRESRLLFRFLIPLKRGAGHWLRGNGGFACRFVGHRERAGSDMSQMRSGRPCRIDGTKL